MGWQLKKYPESPLKRRMRILETRGIDLILDVGANIGQYGEHMRELGYREKIISFEPMREAFDILQARTVGDNEWESYNYGLGERDQTSIINVSQNSFSSSILDMTNTHIKSAPASQYVDKQEIEIKQLDTVFEKVCGGKKGIMLKVDTQGFEKNVIDGAKASLANIEVIQLEMSILPLYQGELLFIEMIKHLGDIGFKVVSLEDGFWDEETGQQLQVDGLFAKMN